MKRGTGLTVLVVDDEVLARQRLEDLLGRREEVDVVLTATSGPAAVEVLRTQPVDLVFLDMQMPGMTGLDVVTTIGPAAMPVTIFVTAFDEYAVRAFEVAALDYLLKPFDNQRFDRSFERAVRHIELQEFGSAAERLVRLIEGERATADSAAPVAADNAAPATAPGRIAVEAGGRIHMIPFETISHITANGPYAEFHTAERTFLVRETMDSLEERLSPEGFFRIHRSTLVRLDDIATLDGGAGGNFSVRLRNGAELSVSRARINALEHRLGVER